MELQNKLEPLLSRYDELNAKLADSSNLASDELIKLSKEHSALTPVVEKIKEYQSALQEIEDLKEMLEDPEMKEIAQGELVAFNKKIPDMEQDIQLALLPKDEADDKNAILEVRAGTGGDEAALFAAELFNMYQHFAKTQGWKFEIMEISETGIGGFRDATASISGTNVFAKMKYESGVHRVQRVPKTESGGRVHTSAATVAVLPEAEEVDIQIDPNDLRVDTYRASGPGGQCVNTTDSAVRITHIPTGIVVSQQDEKSQHKNRAKGMRILRARIYDHERAIVDAERSANRKSQVGSGDRSERVRTYNFPQGRVSDHRINLTLYKLDKFMMGDESTVLEMVNALIAADEAEKLANMLEEK